MNRTHRVTGGSRQNSVLIVLIVVFFLAHSGHMLCAEDENSAISSLVHQLEESMGTRKLLVIERLSDYSRNDLVTVLLEALDKRDSEAVTEAIKKQLLKLIM